jgi:hypothetical protein
MRENLIRRFVDVVMEEKYVKSLHGPCVTDIKNTGSSFPCREDTATLFKKTATTYHSSQNIAHAEASLHGPQDSIGIKLLFRFSLATQNGAAEPDFGFTPFELNRSSS